MRYCPLHKCTLSVLILCMCFLSSKAQDTVNLYFSLDVPTLSFYAQHKVDSLIYYNKINSNTDIRIVGYADLLGTNGYNDTLSTKRALNAKNYLISMGIPQENIKLCVGKGEIPRAIELPEGYAEDRRVDVVMLGQIGEKKTVNKKKKIQRPEPKDAPEPSDDFPVSESLKFDEVSDVDISAMPVGQLIVLDRIFFHTGRHVVKEESVPELEKLLRVMQSNPELKIRIEGHVCCVHPTVDALDIDTGDMALSVNRAKFIYYYLISKGIDEERLKYKGYAKTRPLRPIEATREDQELNKRVEIRILDK